METLLVDFLILSKRMRWCERGTFQTFLGCSKNNAKNEIMKKTQGGVEEKAVFWTIFMSTRENCPQSLFV